MGRGGDASGPLAFGEPAMGDKSGMKRGAGIRRMPGESGATVGGAPWTAQDKAAFIDALATSANVTRSARSIGRTAQAAHSARRRDESFAAEWAVAMEAAYAKLQSDLIAHAMGDDSSGEGDGGETGAADGECPACGAMRGRPFDPALALQVLRYRAGIDGRSPRQGPLVNYRPAPIAEIEASLIRKIAGIVKARKSRARKARAIKAAGEPGVSEAGAGKGRDGKIGATRG